MLVLTRKRDEKIVIGKGKNQIVITILKVQCDKVSIGIHAPPDLDIFRSELLERADNNNNYSRRERQKPSNDDVQRLVKTVEWSKQNEQEQHPNPRILEEEHTYLP